MISWLTPGALRANALRNFEDRGTGSRILWQGKNFVIFGDMSYVSLKNRDVEYGRLSNDFNAKDSRALLLYRSLMRGRSRTLERLLTLELTKAPYNLRLYFSLRFLALVSLRSPNRKRGRGFDGKCLRRHGSDKSLS